METTVLPLTLIKANRIVRLVSIEGGWGLRKRLKEMGLNEGMTFTVLHNHGHGQCIILVGNTRLALGFGMAHKILVKEQPHG